MSEAPAPSRRLRLHHVSQARSFRILWLLHEIGEAPEVVRRSLFDGSMRRTDYLALSPAGRVPALEIDGAAEICTRDFYEVPDA